ncbi:unnamed protein product [Tuber aestivum]|uniref:HMG box domain-containing protein n=1 Tax=Tuber aestivum TaxID=59557 RepID=A0A292PL94_9PEZI|nr:unnamed protein product [Tuber aestivum]
MAMSFGRFLARNILTLTKSNSLPLCRIHAINRFIDNPWKVAAIGIRFESTKAPSKAGATAKRAVKGKPAAKKKTTAKTTSKKGKAATGSKSTAVKKKKPAIKKALKKKKPATKKAVKKKKKKTPKVLTPEQSERRKKLTLRTRVLKAPKIPVTNPFTTFVALGGGTVGVDAANKWKALTPEQRREYAEKARDLHQTGLRDHEKWVRSMDPQEVYKANRARKHLRRLGSSVRVIDDPRIPKRPVPPIAAFLKNQWGAGTFVNPDGSKMNAITALRHSHNLFEKLSAAEKKVYEDRYAAERVAYKKAMDELIGDLNKL